MSNAVQTPAALGGQPVTMATNNWWDGIGSAIKETAGLVTGAAQGYVQVLQAKQLVKSQDVPGANRPPGTMGLNPQAAGIAGGQPQGTGVLAGVSPVVLILGAVLVGLVLVRAAK